MSAATWEQRLGGLASEPMDSGLVVHVARRYNERRRGLAGMDPMPAGHAHTFGMRFDLDLVWLGREGRVLRVDRGVPPRRVRLCLRARSVVEAGAGEGDRFAAAMR
jgi:uncharacterized membrane protein (UPF0127 family)